MEVKIFYWNQVILKHLFVCFSFLFYISANRYGHMKQ